MSQVNFKRVKKSHFVFCPQCYTILVSYAGVYNSKTFTCVICGVEVLR